MTIICLLFRHFLNRPDAKEMWNSAWLIWIALAPCDLGGQPRASCSALTSALTGLKTYCCPDTTVDTSTFGSEKWSESIVHLNIICFFNHLLCTLDKSNFHLWVEVKILIPIDTNRMHIEYIIKSISLKDEGGNAMIPFDIWTLSVFALQV